MPRPGLTRSSDVQNQTGRLPSYSAGPPNIARALSSVPREALKFWDLMHRMYLVTPMAYELGDAKRDINRAQIELVASRASSVLGCFY